jgi:hypothetical protein
VTDHSPEAALRDLQLVIERQKALGRRLMWLLVLPFIMTGVLVYMFIAIKNQISNVQMSIQIESILAKDNNYAWAIREYENIAISHKKRTNFGTAWNSIFPGESK